MTIVKAPQAFRLPDRPKRETDDMTSYRQPTATSTIEPLRHYLGNGETTLIADDQYLCRVVTLSLAGSRYPDLPIALNARPGGPPAQQHCSIAERGKPPDFVLEID